jgi:hypothetical protein
MALAIASFATSAAQSVMSYQQQSAQASMQNAQFEQNRVNALSAMRNDQQQIQLRQQQEMAAAADQVNQRRMQERDERAYAITAAGEAGVSGFSVENILRDIGNLSSQDISTINQNKDWTLDQLNTDLSGTRDTAMSRINSVSQAIAPTPLSLGLSIGAAGLNSVTSYKTMKDKGW